MADDYPEVPFTLSLPEATWLLLTPAERRVNARALKLAMFLATSGLLDQPDLVFTQAELSLLAEMHTRFTEGMA